MNVSVRWLNRYLDPADLGAEEAERVLTGAGFPIESATGLAEGDTRLDVEVTSNRGDCLCHLGLAREIAAATGRKLKVPPGVGDAETASRASGLGPVEEAVTLENRVPALCPTFRVRVIRGVRVGPSPGWLAGALEAAGHRPISNVVDVTNFVALELGQPLHAFDYGRLRAAGPGRAPAVVVREAARGERLDLLAGTTVELGGGELVVSDAGGARPVSLAGVMGGALTEVSGSTTDVLLEGATWDPARVRLAARRHGLRTDASHRFERTVDARTVAAATRRAAALVLEVAGGQMHSGELAAGADLSPAPSIRLRLDRADALLGTCVSSSAARRLLGALGVEVAEEGGRVLVCRPPAWRPDLTREVDLIEEIARLHGLDQVPMRERIEVTVVGPQESETAAREAARVLTAQGFFETVTFTFVSRRVAEAWAPPGAGVLQVCDQRRAAEPALRPSLLPGLLACRKRNHDAGARVRGGVRLFEMARVFAERPKEPTERAMLALLADAEAAPGASEAERRQTAVRLVRGALEEVARTLGGPAARLEVAPLQGEEVPGFEAGATGLVRLGGRRIGHLGLVAARAAALYGLDEGPAGAELELGALLELFPPRPSLAPIPEFPAIERDLSLVVDERVRWEELERLVLGTRPEHLEGVEFVGAFRGRQIGAGRKSLTLRVRFRDPARTLRHEEVDPQITLLVERARAELGATLRG